MVSNAILSVSAHLIESALTCMTFFLLAVAPFHSKSVWCNDCLVMISQWDCPNNIHQRVIMMEMHPRGLVQAVCSPCSLLPMLQWHPDVRNDVYGQTDTYDITHMEECLGEIKTSTFCSSTNTCWFVMAQDIYELSSKFTWKVPSLIMVMNSAPTW